MCDVQFQNFDALAHLNTSTHKLKLIGPHSRGNDEQKNKRKKFSTEIKEQRRKFWLSFHKIF